jgi:hypothetical protein
MKRPTTPPTSDGKEAGPVIDCARIHKAILSGKPGRIGFTRYIHLAFYPPYRRTAGTADS